MEKQLRVTVDNNFFDTNVSDESIKLFLEEKILFYPCLELIGEFLSMHENEAKLELIGELLSMYENKDKRESLKKFSSIFLKMKPKKTLSSWRDLILNDIGIKKCSLYLDDELENFIKDIFHKLANGLPLENKEEEFIGKIKATIHEGKNKMGIKYSEAKKSYEEAKKSNQVNEYSGFEDFFSKEKNKYGELIMKKIFNDNDKQINQDEITKNLTRLGDNSFFGLYLRIYMVFQYDRYIANQKNQKVDMNDFYDQMYLVYLADLDYLISNEKSWIRLGGMVFPNKNRVIKLEHILQ